MSALTLHPTLSLVNFLSLCWNRPRRRQKGNYLKSRCMERWKAGNGLLKVNLSTMLVNLFSSDFGDLPVQRVFYESDHPSTSPPHHHHHYHLPGFEPEYCIDSDVSTICNTRINGPIKRPTALKLELNDSFEYEIRAVKIYRPFDSESYSEDQTQQEGQQFEVWKANSITILFNVYW